MQSFSLPSCRASKWIVGVSCAALVMHCARKATCWRTLPLWSGLTKQSPGPGQLRLKQSEKRKGCGCHFIGRSAGYVLCSTLGEKASQKNIHVQRSGIKAEFSSRKISRGMAIYIRDDVAAWTRHFPFFPGGNSMTQTGSAFFPVEITRGGNGIVYAFEGTTDFRGKK